MFSHYNGWDWALLFPTLLKWGICVGALLLVGGYHWLNTREGKELATYGVKLGRERGESLDDYETRDTDEYKCPECKEWVMGVDQFGQSCEFSNEPIVYCCVCGVKLDERGVL